MNGQRARAISRAQKKSRSIENSNPDRQTDGGPCSVYIELTHFITIRPNQDHPSGMDSRFSPEMTHLRGQPTIIWPWSVSLSLSLSLSFFFLFAAFDRIRFYPSERNQISIVIAPLCGLDRLKARAENQGQLEQKPGQRQFTTVGARPDRPHWHQQTH
jgi:hypothetical protein